jgi:aminoglycoside phosphotransferase (APT) family kinase protein
MMHGEMKEVVVLIEDVSPSLVLGPVLPVAGADLAVTIVGAGGSLPDLPVVEIHDLPLSARQAIARTVAEHTGAAPLPKRRQPWFRQDWIDAVEDWITATGLQIDGAVHVECMWSLSAVLRVPVADDRNVWFKASCEHFRREPRVTQTIARFGGSAVPRVLAAEHDRHWMLLEPLPPTTDDPRRAVATSATMASLQVESIEHLEALRAAGCPARGPTATLDAFDEVARDGVELDQLSAETRETLIEMLPWVRQRLHEFFDCGIPETLVHGDLHLGNVAGADQPVIYDWTDACVSHPYLDAAHIARFAGDDDRAAIEQAYATAFGGDHAQAWAIAPFADQVFQAVTFEAIYRSQEHAARGEMAGVAARILGELAEQYRAA